MATEIKVFRGFRAPGANVADDDKSAEVENESRPIQGSERGSGSHWRDLPDLRRSHAGPNFAGGDYIRVAPLGNLGSDVVLRNGPAVLPGIGEGVVGQGPLGKTGEFVFKVVRDVK